MPSLVVGIGASSGGLESIQTILRGLPGNVSFAIVIIQHVNSDREEMHAELLSKCCLLPVYRIEGEFQVSPGVVYVAPASCCLEIKEGRLRASESTRLTRQATIDHFLAALAIHQKERAVGIVLSGNGTDGTLGLKSISDEGGMTMTQSSESAKEPSMPESAASLGIIDFILTPEMIVAKLLHHAEQMEEVDDSVAKKTSRRVIADNLSVPVDGATQRVSITVQPMPEVGQDASLHFVAFQKMGEPLRLDDPETERWRLPVSTTPYEKAKSLIDQLQSELATTRGNLERTVQELEAANEELQSANEELETSKEELIRSNETLARSNSDIENLLQSTSIATIFLDKQYRIRNFTPAAKAIYALIESDIGRPLHDLSHKVESMPDLPSFDQMQETDQPIENTVHFEDGRWFIRRVHPYRTVNRSVDGMVVTFTEHIHRVVEKFKDAIETKSEFEDTFPLKRQDGVYRWFLTRMIPIFDENENVVRWLGTNTDVTEQKATEAELDHARHMAEAANQAKSDFLANMSHEIRSPMTAILGFADLLEISEKEELEKVETIRRNGQFLLELVNDILDLSKIEAGKVTVEAIKFDPTRLLEDVSSLMSVRAVESGLSLKVVYEDPIPTTITSDPIRMRQVLINLVGNAIKFTEHGGVTLKLRYLESKKQLFFDIVDIGIGISEEKQSRLFRPFEQADSSIVRRYGGSGLGLAISERLAELLGGHIEVRSKVGLGSTFSLVADCVNDPDFLNGEERLTLSFDASDQASSGTIVDHRDMASGSGRIEVRALIVDDRRDIRFLTQHFVKQLGGDVLLAENGIEALQTIDTEEKEGRTIDIVLMDVQMPEMDGFTAVRTLRERGFNRPVIALTANAMDSDRDACIAAGYTDYLSKPIDIQKLTTALRKHSNV